MGLINVLVLRKTKYVARRVEWYRPSRKIFKAFNKCLRNHFPWCTVIDYGHAKKSTFYSDWNTVSANITILIISS